MFAGTAFAQGPVVEPKLWVWGEAARPNGGAWSDRYMRRVVHVQVDWGSYDYSPSGTCVYRNTAVDPVLAARWAAKDIVLGSWDVSGAFKTPPEATCGTLVQQPLGVGEVCIILKGFGAESKDYSFPPLQTVPTRFFSESDRLLLTVI